MGDIENFALSALSNLTEQIYFFFSILFTYHFALVLLSLFKVEMAEITGAEWLN
jgi:hypothetical protein